MPYKVPFVDYPAQYRRMESEIDAAIKEILTKGDFILRSQVTQFENDLASFVGVKYGIGLNSGTDALYLSMRAAEIGPGDEVITVAHTFAATVAVIVHCWATPILIDVAEDHNMNLELLEKAITPKTKAIIPVHLNGRLCDMKKLMDVALEHNLIVIEDAAQSLGANFDGKKAGSFGLTGCFSLYPAKMLGAAGDAGLVLTDNEEIAERIRCYRDHGRSDKEKIAFFGFNSRLDNIQAAILNVKFKYLPQWIDRRRELAQLYYQGLSDLPSLKLLPPPEIQSHFFDVYQNYVIQAQERDRLVTYLEERGIEVLISWPIPLHHQEALGLKHFQLPRTEKIAKEVVSLPMNTEISNEQVEYVVESVRRFYES